MIRPRSLPILDAKHAFILDGTAEKLHAPRPGDRQRGPRRERDSIANHGSTPALFPLRLPVTPHGQVDDPRNRQRKEE
jgi:hypothetical protein